MNIISASRRTDIPAYHAEWFCDAIKKSECEVIQPFTGKKTTVSLRKENVYGFVFWSKNYIPFSKVLPDIKEAGYKFYLNYTVNNYPEILEPLSHKPNSIIENLIDLSKSYAIYWRYDPVYISPKMSNEFHIRNFSSLCEIFKNKVDRVIINFIQEYGKVIKRINSSLQNSDYEYISISDNDKLDLGLELKKIADYYNIKLYSCTPLLYDNSIALKSHCVDKFLIEELAGISIECKESPNYKGCHCHKSIDIGKYGLCKNNCIYCYANR